MNRKLMAGFKIILIVTFVLAGFWGLGQINDNAGEVSAADEGDLKILKSEVTSKAKFYPYKAGKTDMEVIAVKAGDGTIRTALNTCQVCYDSGRGYYTQQGNELVCNNCGNRFKIDQIEKIKFGCNPIPVMPENKTDDGKYITVSKAFLTANQKYFVDWKR